MQLRDDGVEIERSPHLPIALFDEDGCLQGWSPAFAEDCAQFSKDLRGRSVAEVWPEIGSSRWRDIWRKAQLDGTGVVMPVESRTRPGETNEVVELVIGRFIAPGMPLVKVEVRHATTRRLYLMQQEILQSLAHGAPLKSIMETLCRKVEALVPSVTCSILAVENQQLRHIASPSLPADYCRALDGTPIGPTVGSCGTAAFRGEAIEIVDIATNPLWDDYRHLPLPSNLRACWSSPIKSSDGRVLGIFGFYFPRSRGPTPLERQIVATCLNVCMVALEYAETRTRAYQNAFTDTLTRLPNRMRFQQHLSETLAVASATGQRVAVQYLGLDRFQGVNELLGYAAGDDLLRVVAERLRDAVRDVDGLARIGGDEFAIIQVGNLSDEDIAKRARHLIELVREPYKDSGQRLELGGSVGIAVQDDGHSADQLILDAALAMRRAKELGRGTYVFYEKQLNERMQARRRAEADLREALATDQFELYYQPIFDIHSAAIINCEALLRWNHPARGLVSPGEFIPLAEETGMIEQLGAWVMRRACLAAADWPKDIAVAVNLSPVQFGNSGIVHMVGEALAESGLGPERLELEITESVLLRDSAVNIALLDKLSDLGVTISLDDFGTGYSSLSYLQRFSFQRIKIDYTFVRDITVNDGSLKIVRAIVMLAHSLGLEVTAEGVETVEQLAAVRGEGCDAVQGHYLGSPMPLARLKELFARRGSRRIFAG